MLSITVHGKPIAQARPRFVRRGKFVSTYNPQETEAGRFALSVMAQLPEGFKPLAGPLKLICEFSMPIPSSRSKREKQAMGGNPSRDTDGRQIMALKLRESSLVALSRCGVSGCMGRFRSLNLEALINFGRLI